MTQVQIKPKSKYDQHIVQGANWKVFASFAFHRLGTVREALEADRVKDGRVVVESHSPTAARFSDALVTNFEAVARSISCDICVLGNEIINDLPGGMSTPPNISVTFGLVDTEGKISPVVFSPRQVLFQRANGVHCASYDESTDFVSMFKIQFAPTPPELKETAAMFGMDFGLSFG